MFIFFYGISCAHFLDGHVHPYLEFQLVASLAIAVAISGGISGCNINPAISLVHVLRKDHRYSIGMYGVFVGAQVAGVVVALLVAESVNGVKFEGLEPADNSVVGWIRIMLSEMMGVAILIFFVMQLSSPQLAIKKTKVDNVNQQNIGNQDDNQNDGNVNFHA